MYRTESVVETQIGEGDVYGSCKLPYALICKVPNDDVFSATISDVLQYDFFAGGLDLSFDFPDQGEDKEGEVHYQVRHLWNGGREPDGETGLAVVSWVRELFGIEMVGPAICWQKDRTEVRSDQR